MPSIFAVHNRFETHFGQEQARLSRDDAIKFAEDNEVQWTKIPASIATFRKSDIYNCQLDLLFSLFAYQPVYADEWSAFMKSRIDDWQQSAMASTILLL